MLRRLALQQLANNQVNQNLSSLQAQLQQNVIDRNTARTNQLTQGKKDIQDALAKNDFTSAQKVVNSLTGQNVDLGQFVSKDYYNRGLVPYWQGQFAGSSNAIEDQAMQVQKDALLNPLQGDEQLNLNSATTDQERARYQALADLAGLNSANRIIGEQNITTPNAAKFDMGQFNSYMDTLKGQQARIEENRAHTLQRYQKRDVDAWNILHDLQAGAQVPLNGIDEYLNDHGYDRESWDRAQSEIYNGTTPDQVAQQQAAFAQAEADAAKFANPRIVTK
jgi:hypothetical protein